MSHGQTVDIWTPDRVKALRDMWSDGASARAIAAHLGGTITRSAVIGKVHRLKLPARPKTKTKAEAARSASPVVAGARAPIAPTPGIHASKISVREQALRRRDPVRAAAHEAERMAALASIMSSGTPCSTHRPGTGSPKPLVEIGRDDCRFPVGGNSGASYLFCAAKAEPGSPYCEEHRARAGNKVSPVAAQEAA